jgi:hypothetical protein
MIIHLEHHVKQQDLELEERAATIAALEQQLQVPPAAAAPAVPTEPDTVSDVDEEWVVGYVGRQGGLTFVILSG